MREETHLPANEVNVLDQIWQFMAVREGCDGMKLKRIERKRLRVRTKRTNRVIMDIIA